MENYVYAIALYRRAASAAAVASVLGARMSIVLSSKVGYISSHIDGGWR